MPDALLHPIAFVIALSVVVYLHVVLGEMVPKNIALAGPERAALVLGPPMWAIVTVLRPVVVLLNAIANAMLRLLRVEPRDEVSSTYTREEVAALVEESRGEGLLEEDEYDRLAGALGFTEKTVATVLMPPATLDDRAPRVDRRRRRGAVRGHRLQPVPGASPTTVSCSATCTSRTCSRPTRSPRDRVVEDKWIRPFAPVRSPTCSTTRWRRCSAGAPTWRGWSTPTGRSSGWRRSRT